MYLRCNSSMLDTPPGSIKRKIYQVDMLCTDGLLYRCLELRTCRHCNFSMLGMQAGWIKRRIYQELRYNDHRRVYSGKH